MTPLDRFGDHVTRPRPSRFDWFALGLVISLCTAWLGLAANAMWTAVGMLAEGNMIGGLTMTGCATGMIWVLGLEFWAKKERKDATQ